MLAQVFVFVKVAFQVMNVRSDIELALAGQSKEGD